MKSFFKNLFEYNHHSNAEVIKRIVSNEALYSEKAQILVSHTLNAHHIWNARIEEVETKFSVWQLHSLKEALAIDLYNFKTANVILEVKNLQKVIDYTNSKGIHFQNKIQDILFHIINHSTYHRGQLMSELKLQGFTPITTDYIFYKR
ncbi:DinB family protein [Rasiella sp. SM2506]|uniref:DinB family protein n=1 Tax=Rasiella sp. SM2506 TaxID=3423914 RepID=UPI003D7A31E5